MPSRTSATSAAGEASLEVVGEDLIGALQDERSLAATYLLGMEDAIALPVADHQQARAATDAAIAEARTALDDHADQVGDAYAPALEAAAGLADTRAVVDGTPDAERTIEQAAANDVFDQYTTVIDAVFAADGSATSRRTTPRSSRV